MRACDKDKLQNAICEFVDNGEIVGMFVADFNIMLERCEVEAEPIIRCKECKWCHSGYCAKADDLIPFGLEQYAWEDWYCAWGKRG